MWSSEAFLGVPGGVEGFDGMAGVARVGAGVGEAVAVAVGVAVWVGAAVTVGVGLGVGVDLATGVRWLHAPSAMSRMTMALQAVARGRSVMEQFPSPVDEPVPDELVVLRDDGGRHQPL